MEARTVKKRTRVATNAFKLGPPFVSIVLYWISGPSSPQLRRGFFPIYPALTLAAVDR